MRAVSRTSHYNDYFRSNLPREQRRAVLEVLAEELGPETTMGEVIDAAYDIGWGEALGELNLADFAEVLLRGALAPAVAEVETPEPEVQSAVSDEVDEVAAPVQEAAVEAPTLAESAGWGRVDDDEEDDLENLGVLDELEDAEAFVEPVAAPVTVWRTKKVTKKKTKKKLAKKKAAKKLAKKKAAKKVSSKKATKKVAKTVAKKKSTKKAAKKKAAKRSAKKASMRIGTEEEALSLDQAVQLLVPIVRHLKEATMQALEERTGMGRRKLRFHIGQLVKHGHLTRHGMGRGTCYTVS